MKNDEIDQPKASLLADTETSTTTRRVAATVRTLPTIARK